MHTKNVTHKDIQAYSSSVVVATHLRLGNINYQLHNFVIKTVWLHTYSNMGLNASDLPTVGSTVLML
jgi:hypothetical protein